MPWFRAGRKTTYSGGQFKHIAGITQKRTINEFRLGVSRTKLVKMDPADVEVEMLDLSDDE